MYSGGKGGEGGNLDSSDRGRHLLGVGDGNIVEIVGENAHDGRQWDIARTFLQELGSNFS